jgi:creatinine amidohydrolase
MRQRNSMPPNMKQWEDLRGSEFAQLDPEKTIIGITCSPLEVHGPHLPVKADICEGEALSLRTAELLAERYPDLTFLQLPAIYVATDAVPQRGSIIFRSETMIKVLLDLGRSLCQQGFKKIWVGNFHGSPRHFLGIEKAADRVNRKYGGQMISVFSGMAKRLTEGTSDVSELLAQVGGLTKEQLKGDTHGGLVETSMLLHLLGEKAIAPDFRDLPRMTHNQRREKQGKNPQTTAEQKTVRGRIQELISLIDYFRSETYAGNPADASAESGEAILEYLCEQSADVLAELIEGRLGAEDFHSPLWPYRWLFINRFVSTAVQKIVYSHS